jgi:nitrogen fixation/metabolism regulation signal transduction histidine kinase
VILNLINNAFNAVDEKAKQRGNGYRANVTLQQVDSAPNRGSELFKLKVIDNGAGILKK